VSSQREQTRDLYNQEWVQKFKNWVDKIRGSMWEAKKSRHRRSKGLLVRNGYETTIGWCSIVLGLQLAEERQPAVFINNVLVCNHLR
jgi:hypothetical protein